MQKPKLTQFFYKLLELWQQNYGKGNIQGDLTTIQKEKTMNTIQILCTMRIVLAIEKIIFYKPFQQPFFRTGTGDGVQNSFNILMTTKACQNSQKLIQFFGRKRSRLNLLAPLALHCKRLQQCRGKSSLC